MKTAKINRDEVRENTICIPVTKEEKEAVQNTASKIGLTMSAWVRMVLNEKISQK